MPTDDQSAVLVLRADTAAFRDAVVLGQGLPLEKDGTRLAYKWKESLPLGRYLDKDAKPFEVTAARVENLIRNFKAAKSKGFTPPILDRHEKTGSASMGFIVDARKGDNGSLELLHQFCGEDAIVASTRNKTSICTVANVTDEHGNVYDELVDHQALIPDPQLNNLSDFTPALAASRGQPQPAVYLSLSAAPLSQESAMDITKLREAIGAAKEIPDEQVIVLAATKLTESVTKLKEAEPALALSRTQADTITTLTKERDDAKTALANAQQKPEASLLKGWADLTTAKIDLCLSRGQCTKAQADLLKKSLVEGDAPNALMLSKSGGGKSPIDTALEVLELNRSFTGAFTGIQSIHDPNVPPDLVAAATTEAAEYQKRQLQARGMA